MALSAPVAINSMAQCCPNDIPPVVNDYTGKGQKLSLQTEAGAGAISFLRLTLIGLFSPSTHALESILAIHGIFQHSRRFYSSVMNLIDDATFLRNIPSCFSL